MKNLLQRTLLLGVLFFIDAGCSHSPLLLTRETHPRITSYTQKVSADKSIVAHYLQYGWEGDGAVTFLEQQGRVVSEIHGARPLDWHPSNHILVMKESGADDDNKVFLLRIDRGQWKPEGNPLNYTLPGTRYMDQVSWSDDGRVLILKNSLGYWKPMKVEVPSLD